MGIFDQMKAAGMRQVLAYIEKDPDTNILKIIDWMINSMWQVQRTMRIF
jgi:hypothetical protein